MNPFRIFRISKIAGLAAFLINLFLVLLIASTVISVMNLNINVNSMNATIKNNQIIFVTSFTITNNGYYEFNDLEMTLSLMDSSNHLISKSNVSIGDVPIGTKDITVNISFPLSLIITRDDTYTLLTKISGSYVYRLLRFGLSIPSNFTWDAPLDNLTITISYQDISATKANLTAICSFNSPDSYDLPLNITMNVFKGDTLVTATSHFSLVPAGTKPFRDTLWTEVDKGETYTVIFTFNVQSLFNYTYPALEVEVP
ncbi:MAG: hypothetical protein ACP6IS_04305 [Candidatus Asgardarchaeia archaeon]